MARTTKKRADRRNHIRRPVLVALGLFLGLSATGALAAVLIQKAHHAAPTRQLAITAGPASQTVEPGTTAYYSVRVARPRALPRSISGRTNLRVTSNRLPPGAGISVTPRRGRAASSAFSRASSRLAVTTTTSTPVGTYKLRVRAHRRQRRGIATLSLIVAHPDTPRVASSTPPEGEAPGAFKISGDLPAPLTPGSGEPLNLTLVNLESTAISIADLEVRVADVDGPRTGFAHTCGASDFAVEQFTGTFGFELPGSAGASLAELGFAPSEWPKVSMRDLPVNQNDCKGASLTLGFAGTANREAS